eukprot:558602-Rhodomonas_salina.1
MLLRVGGVGFVPGYAEGDTLAGDVEHRHDPAGTTRQHSTTPAVQNTAGPPPTTRQQLHKSTTITKSHVYIHTYIPVVVVSRDDYDKAS